LIGWSQRNGFPNYAAGAIDASRMKADETILGRVDVLEIRKSAGKFGATQETFANAIGIPVKTLRNWEQRRRKPTGPALTLLLLIQKNPRLVVETMNSAA
jgi:putative transcriptional regulator